MKKLALVLALSLVAVTMMTVSPAEAHGTCTITAMNAPWKSPSGKVIGVVRADCGTKTHAKYRILGGLQMWNGSQWVIEALDFPSGHGGEQTSSLCNCLSWATQVWTYYNCQANSPNRLWRIKPDTGYALDANGNILHMFMAGNMASPSANLACLI